MEKQNKTFLDIFDNKLPITDSRMIALIAAKRNFNPDKERRLIEKARNTKCKCYHHTGTNPCMYRGCRHSFDAHYRRGVGY